MSTLKKYIIRLDDACPSMNKNRWELFFNLFDEFGIKPLIATIPDNQDKALEHAPPDEHFWDKAYMWQQKGWEVALHGCHHTYHTKNSGILKVNNYSEFAGLSLSDQTIKIRKGVNIFQSYGINPRVWIAPAHSFDENTLSALMSASSIRTISDGLGAWPYTKFGFTWIPQQLSNSELGLCSGIWTRCYHPNTATDAVILELRYFLTTHHKSVISVNDAIMHTKNVSIKNHIVRKYYQARKMYKKSRRFIRKDNK